MITSIILLIFLGSYFLYSTSKEVMLNDTSVLNKWLLSNIKPSKIIGCVLVMASLVISVFNFGITSGLLYWLIALTTILGLIIILTPLDKANYKHVSAFFLILLLIEVIL